MEIPGIFCYLVLHACFPCDILDFIDKHLLGVPVTHYRRPLSTTRWANIPIIAHRPVIPNDASGAAKRAMAKVRGFGLFQLSYPVVVVHFSPTVVGMFVIKHRLLF
jgi:hypothetical protein